MEFQIFEKSFLVANTADDTGKRVWIKNEINMTIAEARALNEKAIAAPKAEYCGIRTNADPIATTSEMHAAKIEYFCFAMLVKYRVMT